MSTELLLIPISDIGHPGSMQSNEPQHTLVWPSVNLQFVCMRVKIDDHTNKDAEIWEVVVI